MGKATSTIKSVKFDFSDEQVTEVTVEFTTAGDTPINITSAGIQQRKKTFPARISAIDLMLKEVPDYLLW